MYPAACRCHHLASQSPPTERHGKGSKVLLAFVYLDKPKLAGYAAQVDGGLIAETKTRMTKKGSAGANLGFKRLGARVGGSRENEQAQTLSDAPEAQFQRLLAAANTDPDSLAWIEVMDPNADLHSAQVGEIISWECDVATCPTKSNRSGLEVAVRGRGQVCPWHSFGVALQPSRRA